MRSPLIPVPPEAKAALKTSMERMREAEIELPYMECAPETFELIAAMAIEKMSPEEAGLAWRNIRAGVIDLLFFGVKVLCFDDVPEDQLWPPRRVGTVGSERRMAKDMAGTMDDATGMR